MGKNINKRIFIQSFNPDVVQVNEQHQDYLDSFDAGKEYINFNEFVQKEWQEYAVDGNGVTYLVLDKISESDTKLVAYYTLSVNAIPYIDRWKKDESEIKDGIKYDELLCGVPVIEIKMFAVSKDYQDIFYEFDGEEKPISAWILDSIIGYIYELSQNIVSAKAVFLRSVKNAEKFYLDYAEEKTMPIF